MPTPLELTLMLATFLACCALEWWVRERREKK
jgi:hypothetical protein